MKKYLKFFGLVIIFSFLALYYVYNNGYYEQLNAKRRALTDEMIQKYEEDLKNGLNVSKINYLIEEKDYSNIYTKTSSRIADKIENIIDRSIKFIFKKINQMVESG